MARTAKNPEVEITFGEFVVPETVNPWTDKVKELADRNNENAAMTVTVDVNDAQSTQFKIQRAANVIGKTAKLRLKDEADVRVAGQDEDGNDVREGSVKLTFTLSKLHKARRGQNKPAANGASEEAPVVAEEAAPVEAEAPKPGKR
jgi:hypothetical protein